jgi:hypothetical protein
MRIPPQQNLSNIGKGAGLWIEVRDKNGTSVYRRVLDAETFTTAAEIGTGASDRPYVRHTSKRMASLFNAVIPDRPECHSFHVLEQRSSDLKKKPVELIKLDIKKACPPDSEKGAGK